MKYNYIEFNSELKFRNFVLNNINNIEKLYVFEDTLDEIIFFYCITINNNIVATKEKSNYFDDYSNIYKKINDKLMLKVYSNKKVLKLKKD